MAEDNFKWDDILVKEFIHRTFSPAMAEHAEVDEFMVKYKKEKSRELLQVPVEQYKVIDVGYSTNNANGYWYSFGVNQPIKTVNIVETYERISKAIEDVLNDTPETNSPTTAEQPEWIDKYCQDMVKMVYAKEIKQAEEKAFNAARELTCGGTMTGYMGVGLKYPTPQDYFSPPQNKPNRPPLSTDDTGKQDWEAKPQPEQTPVLFTDDRLKDIWKTILIIHDCIEKRNNP